VSNGDLRVEPGYEYTEPLEPERRPTVKQRRSVPPVRKPPLVHVKSTSQ
jgi:hypothetical protein